MKPGRWRHETPFDSSRMLAPHVVADVYDYDHSGSWLWRIVQTAPNWTVLVLGSAESLRDGMRIVAREWRRASRRSKAVRR